MTTKIEWAIETINPIQSTLKGQERKFKNGKTLPGLGYHCTKISPGCKNCYAEIMNQRFGNGEPYQHDAHSEFELIMSELEKPARWKKPRKIFVQSMSDLFHEDVSVDILDDVFEMMVGNNHTYMLLTKRPQRMLEYINMWEDWSGEDFPNLWLGVTVCTQWEADEKIPILLQIPAAVRFVSIEPMLEGIELNNIRDPGRCPGCLRLDVLSGEEIHEDDDYKWTHGEKIDWVIAGCETGPKRRKAQIEWFADIKNQCVAADVPFFLKQMEIRGEIFKMPFLDGNQWRQFPSGEIQ